MHPNDDVCLCFRVSMGKVCTYLKREDPKVASLISECLGAGTGCGWCVPYLKDLHSQHATGQTPTIEGSKADYESGRLRFRKDGSRENKDQGTQESTRAEDPRGHDS
jgi:bacterioferritin-associated ferredoxin